MNLCGGDEGGGGGYGGCGLTETLNVVIVQLYGRNFSWFLCKTF